MMTSIIIVEKDDSGEVDKKEETWEESNNKNLKKINNREYCSFAIQRIQW